MMEGLDRETLEREKRLRAQQGKLPSPLVIGEAPNRAGKGSIVSDIFASGRLQQVGRVRLYERVNLLPEWPGADGAGSAFPQHLARPAAMILHHDQSPSRPFLFVGTRTARAFGLRRPTYEYLRWDRRMLGGTRRLVAVVPHPSGLNHWWNDPEHVRVASEFFADLQRRVFGSSSLPNR